MSEARWAIYIQWDRDHRSPPIGIFYSRGELDRAQREIRQRLRENGKPWHGCVKAERIVDMWTVASWLPLKTDRSRPVME